MTYTTLITLLQIAIFVVAGAQARPAGAQAAAPSRPASERHEVAALDAGPPAASATSTSPSASSVAASPGPAVPQHRRSLLVPVILGGVALALGGDAVAAELSARSTYDRAKREPDDARQASLWHSANTQRYVAEGLGVAGLACAGFAIWRYARGEDREATTSTAQARGWQVTPIVGNDRAGLALEGRY